MFTYNEVIKTIRESISQSKMDFTRAVTLTFVQKLLLNGVPILLGMIIDLIPNLSGNENNLHNALYTRIGLFIAIWLTILCISPSQNQAQAHFTQSAVLKKTMVWFRLFFEKDLNFFSENNSARITNIIERGIHAYERLLGHFCNSVLPTCLEVIIVLILLTKYGGIFSLITVGVLALFQIKLTLLLIAKRRHKIDEVNEIEDTLAEESNGLLNKGFVFQIYLKVDYVLNRLYKNFAQYASVSVGLSKSASIMALVSPTFQNLATIIGLCIGIFYFNLGQMTLGEIVTLITLFSRIFSVIGESVGSLRVFDQFLADIEALKKLATFEKLERSGVEIRKLESIALCQGEYKENGLEMRIPQNINFRLGDRIAIIGPSGSGKSTLLNLLFGTSKNARKQVLWNQIPLDQISHQCQLDLSSYCPQNPNVFLGTIFENLLSDKLNNIETNFASLQLSHLSGMRNLISDSTISGGEAKRISLLRCLNKQSSIRFFDEPTSGLNHELGEKVWDLLLNENLDGITFCSTHDYSKLNKFNRAFKVENQTIVEIAIEMKAELQPPSSF